MKTKLLRRIRRQYSIVYYPNGYKVSGMTYISTIHYQRYVIRYRWGLSKIWELDSYASIDEAKRALIRRLREKYDRKKYIGIKVWHNEK